MKLTFKILTLFMLLGLLLMPTGSVYAQGPDPGNGGRVIFASNFTLKSGDTFDGDLVVIGGNVTIEEDATLNGDLVVIGGTIESDGETSGSMVVVGGQITLGESAQVAGDVVTIGGQLDQAEGAEIQGEVVNNVAPNITLPSGRIPPREPETPGVPTPPEVVPPNINVHFNPFAEFFGIIFWAVGAGAFSMLLALFLQPQITRTGTAIVSQPLMTAAIGLVSVLVAAIFFLTLLPPILVIFAWFFGVVALGQEVGERFTKAINQEWSPVMTIGFGTFLLVLAGGVIGLIPCLGGLVLFLVGLIGVGASIITLFGTRPIQVPALTVYTQPTTPPGSGEVPPAS
jgi:cytoskeletal protein CcmA (bactofilin family)